MSPLRHRNCFFMAVLVSCSLVALTISVHADGSSPWLPWKAELHQDHQLAGSIWSAKESGFIEPQTLVQSLVDETYVLIGETHDNPDHHLIQAWLIEEISEQRLVGLVVEMINSEQVEAIDDYLVSPDASAEGLGAVLDWEASGWPDWSIYRPIAEAAIAARLAFHPGDPGRDRVRRIGKEGLASLGPQRRQELGLERDLPADLNQALADELMTSHCDLLPEQAMPAMAVVQRFKDAFMADALRGADKGEGAILIAGNGHVRLDRGVPYYLDDGGGTKGSASVMLVELNDSATSESDLIEFDADSNPIADFFWFTPRADRPDPCDGLREYLKKPLGN